MKKRKDEKLASFKILKYPVIVHVGTYNDFFLLSGSRGYMNGVSTIPVILMLPGLVKYFTFEYHTGLSQALQIYLKVE